MKSMPSLCFTFGLVLMTAAVSRAGGEDNVQFTSPGTPPPTWIAGTTFGASFTVSGLQAVASYELTIKKASQPITYFTYVGACSLNQQVFVNGQTVPSTGGSGTKTGCYIEVRVFDANNNLVCVGTAPVNIYNP